MKINIEFVPSFIDAKNLNSTFDNFPGALDWTFCQVWIPSVKAKFVFYSVDFFRG